MPIAATLPPVEPMLPRPCRVRRREHVGPDTWTMELDPPGGALPFAPGQFNMLYAFGVGEAAISISGDPARPDTLVHTVRAVGAVSRALCEAGRGATVGVRGPYGTAWPLPERGGTDVLLVAGGLGLAPLRPVVHALLARLEQGHRAPRRAALLVGARTPEHLPFADELPRWRARGLEVVASVDAADASWSGDVGPVTRMLERLDLDPGAATALICGPELMMRYTARGLLDMGLPAGHIHLSLERSMKCAIGLCGHCQLGPALLCRDGPVFDLDTVGGLLEVNEL